MSWMQRKNWLPSSEHGRMMPQTYEFYAYVGKSWTSCLLSMMARRRSNTLWLSLAVLPSDDFDHHAAELQYDVVKKFQNNLKFLVGTTLWLWQQIFKVDPGYPANQQMDETFMEAWQKLLDKFCNCKDMSDMQIHWLQNQAKNPAMIDPTDCYFHFNEMLSCTWN